MGRRCTCTCRAPPPCSNLPPEHAAETPTPETNTLKPTRSCSHRPVPRAHAQHAEGTPVAPTTCPSCPCSHVCLIPASPAVAWTSASRPCGVSPASHLLHGRPQSAAGPSVRSTQDMRAAIHPEKRIGQPAAPQPPKAPCAALPQQLNYAPQLRSQSRAPSPPYAMLSGHTAYTHQRAICCMLSPTGRPCGRSHDVGLCERASGSIMPAELVGAELAYAMPPRNSC